MEKDRLKGLKVAILVANGFEQDELLEPRKALEEAGAETFVVSPEPYKVKSLKKKQWSDEVEVDQQLDDASPEQFDALVLPGGVINPDLLRMNKKAVAFVKHFFETNKPVGAICHGPWMLVEADVVRNRAATSYQSISTDLKNAGAIWKDEETVVDGNLVTSRKPSDIPAFNKKIIEVFAEAVRVGQLG